MQLKIQNEGKTGQSPSTVEMLGLVLCVERNLDAYWTQSRSTT
jgi:hypothetical protein